VLNKKIIIPLLFTCKQTWRAFGSQSSPMHYPLYIATEVTVCECESTELCYKCCSENVYIIDQYL